MRGTLDSIKKLRRAIRRHGLIGLLGLTVKHVVEWTNMLRPSVRAELRERKARALTFDRTFGVDTVGSIDQSKLKIQNPNQLHAVAYVASDPKYFTDAFRALPIDYEKYVFIDFGSGKGRALLLAAEFPFKRIVGVEFSEELHEIARQNINRYHSDTRKCKDVESVFTDAVSFALPDDCLVCYFFNPFDETIMSDVLTNITRAYAAKPRDIYIVYYNARHGHLIDRGGPFKKMCEIGPVHIWRTADHKI